MGGVSSRREKNISGVPSWRKRLGNTRLHNNTVCACEITHNEMPFTKIILLGVLCYAILSFLHEGNSIGGGGAGERSNRDIEKIAQGRELRILYPASNIRMSR